MLKYHWKSFLLTSLALPTVWGAFAISLTRPTLAEPASQLHRDSISQIIAETVAVPEVPEQLQVTKITLQGIYGLADWTMGEAGGMVALVAVSSNTIDSDWDVIRLPGGMPTASDLSQSTGMPVEIAQSLLDEHIGNEHYTLELVQGYGTLRAPNGSVLIDGMLEQDGTAGMSYILSGPEGHVCGDFYLSRWDPNNEGQSLTNQISVEWLPPSGSVASTCGTAYYEANGIYSSNSNSFQGTFTKN